MQRLGRVRALEGVTPSRCRMAPLSAVAAAAVVSTLPPPRHDLPQHSELIFPTVHLSLLLLASPYPTQSTFLLLLSSSLIMSKANRRPFIGGNWKSVRSLFSLRLLDLSTLSSTSAAHPPLSDSSLPL